MAAGKREKPRKEEVPNSLSVNSRSFKPPNKNNTNNNNNNKKKNERPMQQQKETSEGETPKSSQIKLARDSFLSLVHSPPSQKLKLFFQAFEKSKGVKLSSLELEGISDSSVVQLTDKEERDLGDLSEQLKAAFGDSWKEELCENQILEGEVDAGNPAVIIVSPSALRSLQLLRSLKSLTRECHAVKLFAKHMKVDEQVALLKGRVNIAGGTPSRIKKLIDIDALGLQRLSVLLLDMHVDYKGYCLLSLPQVSSEFWDLYKTHFHDRLQRGELRLCFF